MMEYVNILVVDDDAEVGKIFKLVLKKEGVRVVWAGTWEEGNELLNREAFDLVFLDLYLPDGNGMELMRKVKQKLPDLPVVIMTGRGSVALAVEAMKGGALDFLLKPISNQDLIKLTVARAAQQKKILAENLGLKQELGAQYGLDRLVGKSEKMQKIFRIVRQLSENESTVLILGESGTGKEMLARAVHFNSPRRLKKFVPVDCGSLPETLIESELFGHLKGAFTDAYREVKGLFREADAGTIFLDEIGELPLRVQSKLLRALQEREVRPIGSETAVSVDVRVIAATKRDLAAMAARKEFREDLFYRLNVVRLELPPLREKPEDIPLLARHFLEEYGRKLGKNFSFAPETLSALAHHPWPGNVRELQNCVEQALALCDHSELKPADLDLGRAPAAGLAAPAVAEEVPLSFEAYEKLALERALSASGGKIPEAARMLNVGQSTLYRKLKAHGIKAPDSGKN